MVQKYPARKHARKVALELGKAIPEEDRSKLHAIFIQSAPGQARWDTDRELPYHQEANFSYLTGCPTQSASLFVIFSFPSAPSLIHANVHHHLLVPEADPLETMWSVAPPTLDESKDMFDSDKVSYLSETIPTLKQAAEQVSAMSKGKLILHTLPNTLEFPPLPEDVNAFLDKGLVARKTDLLLDALHRARLTKDEFEIKLIREANRISSGAHQVLMSELGRFAEKRKAGQKDASVSHRSGKEGVSQWEVESENDAEALFVATCKRSGAGQAYLPICASGTRASTLHYVCNDKLFPSTAPIRQPGDTSFKPRQLTRGCCGGAPHDHKEEEEVEPEVPTAYHNGAFEPQVLLIDAGCEWKDYASDITRTIPVGNGGKFTEKAGQIYDLVLKMQKECEALVKPGVHWDSLHLHAHRVLVDGFLSLGIFTGTPEDVLQSGVTAAFLPHGLGHSLGLDVHDSRQLLKAELIDLPEESKKTPAKLYTYLRIRRPLETGMVLTVEPGCYFPPQLMDEHKVWESQYVNKDKLKEYTSVGGVRLEDVIVVREGGSENLTTVGRDRSWVEAVCSGQEP